MAGDLTLGWARSRIVSAKSSTVQLDATSSTTFATVSGLTHKLQGNTTYVFSGHLTGVAGASGGVKVAMVSVGGLTTSSVTYTGQNFNGTTLNALSTTTTLGNAVGGANAIYTDFYISGTISVAVGGVLALQATQNTSNGTATSVYVGSNLVFTPVH